MHGPAFEKFPTISDIADMIGRIGARYAGETERRFEAFVVGQTPHRTGNPPVQVFKFGCDEAGRLMVRARLTFLSRGASIFWEVINRRSVRPSTGVSAAASSMCRRGRSRR
jgi:hypothetical protein